MPLAPPLPQKLQRGASTRDDRTRTAVIDERECGSRGARTCRAVAPLLLRWVPCRGGAPTAVGAVPWRCCPPRWVPCRGGAPYRGGCRAVAVLPDAAATSAVPDMRRQRVRRCVSDGPFCGLVRAVPWRCSFVPCRGGAPFCCGVPCRGGAA